MKFTQHLWDKVGDPSNHRLIMLDSAVSAVVTDIGGPALEYVVVLRVYHTDLVQPFDLVMQIDPSKARAFHDQLGQMLTEHPPDA